MKNVKLIALDMDGTLLMSDHWTVPQRNMDAIRRADAAGIHVCICTGRMLEDASDFCRRLDLPCKLIACNGTRAADGLLPDATIFYRQRFAPEDAHAALDLLLSTDLMITAFEDGQISTRLGGDKEEYHLVKRKLVTAMYGEEAVHAAADRGVMKLYIVGTTEDSEKLAKTRALLHKQLPHIQITSSGARNIELMPPGAGKGTALRVMAAYYGLERENVMAVGDAQNDLSMLEYATHSVAMGNALDEVKRVCRYQTADNDACGVAQIIERVLVSRED